MTDDTREGIVDDFDELLAEDPPTLEGDVPGELEGVVTEFERAERTIETHREWLYDRALPVGSGEVLRYWVLQPGLPIGEQLEAMEGCQGVFVGGPRTWKRAFGDRIVKHARDRDLRTHVGNPGGADGLVWAYQAGFDSCDTTTVFQNGYWHYLDRLEAATEEVGAPPDPDVQSAQAHLRRFTEVAR